MSGKNPFSLKSKKAVVTGDQWTETMRIVKRYLYAGAMVLTAKECWNLPSVSQRRFLM
ncbi:MAG: hypothetical protein M1162_05070 [Candidatus Thermoplasmatota archaeon]|nr:hypothetical protein [Candidatus Thermoplasmatota archaeon]